MSSRIEFSDSIQLSTETEPIFRDILQRMFPDYQRVLVKKEFEGGFSGSWVFLVHLSRDKRPELPVVVKMASVALIDKEWQAYSQHIRGKWPATARIRNQPVSDGTYSGLCYSFVGEGVFPTESLRRYCLSETTTVTDIEKVFSRLAVVLERGLRFRERISTYRLWATYDPLLPFNLLIKPVSEASASKPPFDSPISIAPNALPTESLKPNRYVCLENFEVVKVNLKKYNITLNLPRPAEADQLPKNSYYVCLQFEPGEKMPACIPGQTIPVINGRVIQTRDEKWQEEMDQVLPSFDLAAETVSLPDGRALPNPLAALCEIRNNYVDVQVDYIHGDLNLENVLVDPEVRDVRLIDFGLVRRDHVLHDLLRLETEIVTKILPPALVEAGLPAQHIYEFYQQLHCATFHSEPISSARPSHPALEKPFAILKAVRKIARDHGLFNSNKYAEYYDGLTLYLLGTLKFGNLNRKPDDPKPWPKEVAFWGAATAQHLLTNPLSDADCLSYQVAPLATVINVKPEVQVVRAGRKDWQPASFGMNLQRGDRVMTFEQAVAEIVCNNQGIIKLSSGRNWTVDCRQDGDGPEVLRLPTILRNPLAKVSKLLANVGQFAWPSPVGRLGKRAGEEDMPILLTPRNTFIADPRPTFRWQPVEGARGYRIRVILPRGRWWERETNETYLPYPYDEPPLSPRHKEDTFVSVATLDDPDTADKVWLRMIDDRRLDELNQAKAALLPLEVDSVAKRYLLAQLDQQFELHSAAIEELEGLSETQENISANLWQQLGDLYTLVALYAQAEKSYQTVLSSSEATIDQTIQASALVGLARVAYALGNKEQALEQLNEAERLYREAEEVARANLIAAQSSQLRTGP